MTPRKTAATPETGAKKPLALFFAAFIAFYVGGALLINDTIPEQYVIENVDGKYQSASCSDSCTWKQRFIEFTSEILWSEVIFAYFMIAFCYIFAILYLPYYLKT